MIVPHWHNETSYTTLSYMLVFASAFFMHYDCYPLLHYHFQVSMKAVIQTPPANDSTHAGSATGNSTTGATSRATDRLTRRTSCSPAKCAARCSKWNTTYRGTCEFTETNIHMYVRCVISRFWTSAFSHVTTIFTRANDRLCVKFVVKDLYESSI